jgi:hypothetical protein
MNSMKSHLHHTQSEPKGSIGTESATPAGEARKRTVSDGKYAIALVGWRLALVVTLVVTSCVAVYLLGDAPTVNGALVAVGGEVLALVGLGAYALWLRDAGCRMVIRHLEILRTRRAK